MRSRIFLGAIIAAAAASSAHARAETRLPTISDVTAGLARGAILELDLATAHTLLDSQDNTDPAIALERARLAIYEGDCDRAVEHLSRSDLAMNDETRHLGDIARGCARGMAGTIIIEDKDRGVWVR